MKASQNQILIAASNILSGITLTDSNIDESIDTAINIAIKLANAIPDDDIIGEPSKIKEIIMRAYKKLNDPKNVPTSLLQETIRMNEGVNRMTAVAYMQLAASLKIIIPESEKGTKVIKYALNKKR